MDTLTALSLAAADLFCTADSDTFDWLRTDAALAAIAVSEAPHCAIALALNITTSTDKAATLTPVMLWIVFNIPMLPIAILRTCDLVNHISSSSVAINGGRSGRLHARSATSGAHAAIAAILSSTYKCANHGQNL